MTTTQMKRNYIEAGGEYVRTIDYGTRLWIKEKEAGPDAIEEQAFRLRGTAREQRDEWLLSDDAVLSSAELVDQFLIALPEFKR